MQGLIGRKIGMTRVFDKDGRHVAVTVIQCGPCVVLQRKRKEKDGYDAVQLGFGSMAEKNVARPGMSIFKKLNVPAARYRVEFRLDAGDEYKEGDVISASVFDGVSHVDVSGVTKGKGFQGVVRRHRMSGGPITHGGHSKRRPGAVGCRELPGRIHKGKRMPGHMGFTRITLQNLKLMSVINTDDVILVGGGVPGHSGSILTIRKSFKKSH